MELICISRVKNEIDIIEAFVRHNAAYFAKIIVSDDGSTDGTYDVLQSLREEGLPLVVLREPAVGYWQSENMTRLMRMAVDQFGADWIVPLDADEFIEPLANTTLAQALQSREPTVFRLGWQNFVWRKEDDQSRELNPVLRLRFRMPPRQDLNKVLVPAKRLTDGPAELVQGNHALRLDGQLVLGEPLPEVNLCHFPIRSVAQFAGKVAIGYLQCSAMPHWTRNTSFQFLEPFRLLAAGGLGELWPAMTGYSQRYSATDDQLLRGDPAEAPLRYVGGPLMLTPQRDTLLGDILEHAETLALRVAECLRQNESTEAEIDLQRKELERLLRDCQELAAAKRAGAEAQLAYSEITASTSWRLTAPLRWTAQQLKNLGAWCGRIIGSRGRIGAS